MSTLFFPGSSGHAFLRRARGFSIMEMALALALIGVLAAAALPKASLGAAQSQARTAEQALSALRQARAAAIAAGRPIWVSVAPGSAAFCWETPCPAGGGSASPVLSMTGAPLSVSASVDAALSGASFAFEADGTLAAPASLAVGPIGIEIDPSTGVASRAHQGD